MTNESHPELGSGALREALREIANTAGAPEGALPSLWATARRERLNEISAMAVAALSLSSPIEPPSVEHGITPDYVAGQEREAANARLVARERGYTIPDDWTSQEVIRHITGWPAQASSEIRERVEAELTAIRGQYDKDYGKTNWFTSMEHFCKRVTEALAPSRQGAGGK